MTQDEALNQLKLGSNCFITGPAGTGKTYVLNEYIKYLKKHHVNVAITASTGIAATHMNGTTIHSWSGIHLDQQITPTFWQRIRKIKGLEDNIKNTKVLIIDEVSMLHHFRLDMINQVCQRVRGNMEPFGGIQVVMSGDFFQLPPVLGRDEPPAQFVTESSIWSRMNLKVLYLTKQYRQNDNDFLQILSEIRAGKVEESSKRLLESRLNQPVELKINIETTQLYANNWSVDDINIKELAKLKDDEVQFVMTSRGAPDLVVKLKNGCMAPEDLRLKKGTVVMFVRNNIRRGYVNGTLGVVKKFDRETGYPVVETVRKKRIVATPEAWNIESGDEVVAGIAQVPLRLAWAITIHKSQGMSLDAATIDLSKVFVEGMGYVALSRVRRLEGIKLLGLNDMVYKTHPETIQLDKSLQEQSSIVIGELNTLGRKHLSKNQKEVLKLFKLEPVKTVRYQKVALFD